MSYDLVVEKLKTLYEQTNPRKNGKECSKLFYDLSKYYRHGDAHNKWAFVQQCALLNGALSGCDDNESRKSILSDINEIGTHLLRNAAGNGNARDFNLVEFSNSMKKDIELKRNEMAAKLKESSQISYEICDKEETKSIELDTIAFVRDTMQATSCYYAATMEKISNKCVEALGDPPCTYSHFAMGSLARQEITLYSDFENGIILGDEVDWKDTETRENAIEYFRWYATLFDLVLINFGETPISLVDVPGLNDHYSKDESKDWFRDTLLTCGIMFDSCLPYASKNPFGRKPTFDKPEGTELILPWNEMLQYLNEDKSLKEGYHLSNMLIESRDVAGNTELFQKFWCECIRRAKKLRLAESYMNQELKYTRENLTKFNLTPTFNKIGWAQHAKKSFYRPMSLHIPFIARVCGNFASPSPSDSVEKLKDAGLSEKVTHRLLYATAMANLIRMKVYSDRTKQSDHLAGSVFSISNASNITNIFDAVGDSSALDYYETASGLRSAVIEIVDEIEKSLASDLSCDFALGVVIRCLEKHLQTRGDEKLRGDIHRRFQNYDKACLCYEAALASPESCDAVRQSEILMSLGSTNVIALRFIDALKWYEKLIKFEKSQHRGRASSVNIATALTMSGQCFTEEPTIREGFAGCIEEAETTWISLLSLEPENKEYLKGLAELRDTEAFYYLRIREYGTALRKYREAEAAFEKCLGSGISDNDTAKVKNGIAMSLLHLERFEEALEMFDEVIAFKRKVAGDDVADVNMSWYLRHKGICLQKMGRYEEAVSLFQESIKIRLRAPGSSFDVNSAVANTHRFLAQCHLHFRKFEEAIKSSQKVIELTRRFPETDTEKRMKGFAEEVISESQKLMKIE